MLLFIRLGCTPSGEKKAKREENMKLYTTPRLVAIVFNESDAVRTSNLAKSEQGFGDIFAEVASGNPATGESE